MGFLSSILGRNNKTEVINMETHTMTGHEQGAMTGTAQVKDLVCGMDIDPATAAAKSEYMGKTYYFCAPGCKRAFDADPARYVENEDKKMAGHHHGGGCCC
jgi:YHS domain-containing protein